MQAILSEAIGYYDKRGQVINRVPAETLIEVVADVPQYELVIGLLPDGTEGIIPYRCLSVLYGK